MCEKEVVCANIINGCDKRFGTVQDERNHRRECKFKGEAVLMMAEILDSLNPSLPQAPEKCGFCQITASDGNVSSQSSTVPQDLREHVKSCPHRAIPCPFEGLGCKKVCTALTIEDYQKDLEEHFLLLYTGLNNLVSSMSKKIDENMKDQILDFFENITQEIESLEKEKKIFEDRIEKLEKNPQATFSELNLRLKDLMSFLVDEYKMGPKIMSTLMQQLLELNKKENCDSQVKLCLLKKEVGNYELEKKKLLQRITQLEKVTEKGKRSPVGSPAQKMLSKAFLLDLTPYIDHWKINVNVDTFQEMVAEKLYGDESQEKALIKLIYSGHHQLTTKEICLNNSISEVNGTKCKVEILHFFGSYFHRSQLWLSPLDGRIPDKDWNQAILFLVNPKGTQIEWYSVVPRGITMGNVKVFSWDNPSEENYSRFNTLRLEEGAVMFFLVCSEPLNERLE